MEINTAIYQEFHAFVINSLRDVLQETKEAITSNSLYRYGGPMDKIKAIEELKRDHGTHFNFLNVKGVKYSAGEISIVETEFRELIRQYQVNLKNSKYGLFENKNDKEKPFAYKSYIQVVSILTYCLQLQIYNEAKQEIEKPQRELTNFTPNLTVFKNPESQKFFDFLYNDWLKDIANCRPQLSYIVWAMRKEEKSNVINDFAIICPTLKDFVEFWNTTYSHSFKLTYKKSKINLQDWPSDKHQAPFDTRKEYFKNVIM